MHEVYKVTNSCNNVRFSYDVVGPNGILFTGLQQADANQKAVLLNAVFWAGYMERMLETEQNKDIVF